MTMRLAAVVKSYNNLWWLLVFEKWWMLQMNKMGFKRQALEVELKMPPFFSSHNAPLSSVSPVTWRRVMNVNVSLTRRADD